MKKTALIYIPVQRLNASQRLVCFSYAGGNASTYMGWAESLDSSIELAVIQLPGRSTRLMTPPYQTMEDIVGAVTDALIAFNDKPYIFYGHSMGARVAYEVAVRLYENQRPIPTHVFAAASIAPNSERSTSNSYLLPDKEFLQKIASLNGTPKAVLQNEELMQLIMPALRADFKIIETYCNKSPQVLPSCVSVLVGDKESINPSDLEAWLPLFTDKTGIHTIAGDHFFVDKNASAVIKLINTLACSGTHAHSLGARHHAKEAVVHD